MIEKPILFSTPMVRAIQAGTKTQTRRLAKQRRRVSLFEMDAGEPMWADCFITDEGNRDWLLSEAPVRPGEGLWVREAFRFDRAYDTSKPSEVNERAAIWYEAGGVLGAGVAGKLRPGMFMPRPFSRIDLTCTDVRVDRLQAITEEDALAEGITVDNVIVGSNCYGGVHCEETADRAFYEGGAREGYEDAVTAYRALWESLHGHGSFEANPLVWKIKFQHRGNDL